MLIFSLVSSVEKSEWKKIPLVLGWYLLSLGYKISEQEYGDVYYKKYESTEFYEARETCEKDGASLPVPQSGGFSFNLQLRIDQS